MNKLSKKDTPQLECMKCNKVKGRDANFYNSNSKLFGSKVPICKKCIKDTVDYSNMNTIYDILQQLDVAFDFEYWDTAVKSKHDTFGRYITMSNSMPQLKGRTWKNSRFEKTKSQNGDIENNKDSNEHENFKPSNFYVTEKIVEKWGYGYETDEYREFERKYAKLQINYGQKTALHTEGLLSYIRFRVKEEMSTARGDIKEAKEWGAMASKAAQDAKINVSQLSKSDISGGVDVLAQLFEAVETEVGVLPLLPKLLEQPYDDVDLTIWANINYYRKLEDKPLVPYRDIWNFYDEMLGEFFTSSGFNKEQIKEFKEKRNNVFRDLGEIYIEPLNLEDDSS